MLRAGLDGLKRLDQVRILGTTTSESRPSANTQVAQKRICFTVHKQTYKDTESAESACAPGVQQRDEQAQVGLDLGLGLRTGCAAA